MLQGPLPQPLARAASTHEAPGFGACGSVHPSVLRGPSRVLARDEAEGPRLVTAASYACLSRRPQRRWRRVLTSVGAWATMPSVMTRPLRERVVPHVHGAAG